MMKATVLSAILSLTSHNAGAFVGHPGSPSTYKQNPNSQHATAGTTTTCFHVAQQGLSFPPPKRKGETARIAQRRQSHRIPRVVSMSAAGGENAAEAGDKEEEERTAEIDNSSSAASGAAPDAETQECLEGEGDGDGDNNEEEGPTAEGAGVADQEEKKGEGGAGGGEEEVQVPEGEEEGETVYLPAGDNSDFRLFRAKLRAGSDEKWREQLKRNVNVGQLAGQDAWAHELSAPEKGCLIVAKSTEFSMAQTYFNEAVIFLASHDDELGSAGFILNRPTTVQLGDLVEGNALPQFRRSPLYLGGDVGEGNVQILHPYGPDKLSDSMEIIPGVYIGGAVNEADHMVATGQAEVDDFKFMLHLCGWAPGQLQSEIDRGVWLPVASSANVVLKHCLQLPVPLWREVMTLMGPKYGLLARDTYDDL